MGRDIVVTPRVWTPRGEAGLAVRGRPMIVWQGIVGESARVRVVEEGQNQDYAVFRESPHPSRHRVAPPCDRYHVCGGCPFMHMDAAGQADARRAIVLDALAEEGLDDLDVGDVIPSPDGQTNYRHVVKLGVGWSDLGRLRVGAWGRHTRSIVPIPECHVAAPVLRKVMGVLAHHVIELRIPPYDPETDQGVLRAFVLRAGRSSGEVLVTIVVGRRTRALSDLATMLVREASEVVGVAVHVNAEETNAIFDREDDGTIASSLLEGRGWVEDELGGVTYRIGVGDFFQTNPGMAEVLYKDTLTRLGVSADVPLVDLYCGVGGFALAAAAKGAPVVGVEEVAGAVDAAREAARRNGVRAEFIGSRVDEALGSLARRFPGVHPLVTVNPARRGLEPGVLQGILALAPRKVAYISCNPRALARDLAAFREAGMKVGPVFLYDMFPHTPHVEAVVVIASGTEPISRRAPRRSVVGRAGDRA